MFQDLLESKYEGAILALLLVAPERAFSVKELARRLHLPDRPLRASLHELERLNIVKTFSKRNQKYYLVNIRHKVLPEIRTSLLKHQPYFEDELLVSIKKLGQIRAAFLSGLFTGHPELPVDVLLVGRVNLNKLDAFLRACKKMMGQDINYSVMSEQEFKLRRNTFDRFIKDIFDYKHIVVVDYLSPATNKKKKK